MVWIDLPAKDKKTPGRDAWIVAKAARLLCVYFYI